MAPSGSSPCRGCTATLTCAPAPSLPACAALPQSLSPWCGVTAAAGTDSHSHRQQPDTSDRQRQSGVSCVPVPVAVSCNGASAGKGAYSCNKAQQAGQLNTSCHKQHEAYQGAIMLHPAGRGEGNMRPPHLLFYHTILHPLAAQAAIPWSELETWLRFLSFACCAAL